MLFVGNFAHMIISAPRIPTIFCLTAFRGPPIDRMGIPALSTDTPRRLRSAVVYPNVAKTHFSAYQFVCRYDWDAVVNDLAREDPRQSVMQRLLYDGGQPARFSLSLDARGSSGSTFHWCCGRNCIQQVIYHQHAAESDMFSSQEATRSFLIQAGPRRFLGRARHFSGSECRCLTRTFRTWMPRLPRFLVPSCSLRFNHQRVAAHRSASTHWYNPAGRAAVWSGSSGSSMALNVSKTSSALGRPPGSSSQACTQSASKT